MLIQYKIVSIETHHPEWGSPPISPSKRVADLSFALRKDHGAPSQYYHDVDMRDPNVSPDTKVILARVNADYHTGPGVVEPADLKIMEFLAESKQGVFARFWVAEYYLREYSEQAEKLTVARGYLTELYNLPDAHEMVSYHLGLMCCKGLGGHVLWDDGLRLLKESIRERLPNAIKSLQQLHQEHPDKFSLRETLSELLPTRGEPKHKEVFTALGEAYFQAGRGQDDLAPNIERAVAYFKEAAKLGDRHSQFRLGECYKYGWGIEPNNKKMIRQLNNACEQGHSEAKLLLAKDYRDRGIKAAEATTLFKAAFIALSAVGEQATSHDHYLLSGCYATGSGTRQSLEAASIHLNKAAEMGSADAQYVLGRQSVELGTSTKRAEKIAKGLRFLMSAEQQNHMDAICLLGECYLKGTGVKRDPGIAVAFFEKASILGSVEGQYYYALCAKNGWGVAQSDVIAVHFLEQAAAAEHSEAAIELGRAYLYGELGLAKDVDKAIAHFKPAKRHAHKDADYYLGISYNEKEITRLASNFFRIAAKAGHSKAEEELRRIEAPPSVRVEGLISPEEEASVDAQGTKRRGKRARTRYQKT